MKNKTLIYIGIPNIAAQVVKLLESIKKSQFFDRIILLIGVKNKLSIDKNTSILESDACEIIPFIQYPNYPFYNGNQKKEFYRVLKNILRNNTIIHTRGEGYVRFVRHAIDRFNYNNVKILSDIRGALVEETQIYNRFYPIQHQLKIYQQQKNLKLVGPKSDGISCVSEQLRQYVLNNTQIDSSKIFVKHCFAGYEFTFSREVRKRYREKLGLYDEDVVFLFVTGNDSKWQNTDVIVKSIVDKGYKILNLSKRKIELHNVINLYVPYSEVPNYLNAADIGIIWRNDDVVNNVASPTKFSEYVCCGLPVIANRGVSLVIDYISESGYGKIVNQFNDINSTEINRLISMERDEISRYAYQFYSLEVITNNYIKIYNELLHIT